MKAKVPKFTVAICTTCGKKAVVTPEKDVLDGGIEHHYYKCGECGYKATVCYTDAAIRRAMAEQKALRAAGDPAANENAKRIQAMMDALKETMVSSGKR